MNKQEFEKYINNLTPSKLIKIMPTTLYIKKRKNSKEAKEYWLYTTLGVEGYKPDELYGVGYDDEDYEKVCEFRGKSKKVAYIQILLRLFDNGHLSDYLLSLKTNTHE